MGVRGFGRGWVWVCSNLAVFPGFLGGSAPVRLANIPLGKVHLVALVWATVGDTPGSMGTQMEGTVWVLGSWQDRYMVGNRNKSPRGGKSTF
jgi:hypothetical protein